MASLRGLALAAALALAGLACAGGAPPASCAGDLRGVYRDAADRPWMLLDHGATLEVYPLFDDAGPALTAAARAATPPQELGPRTIQLARAGLAITGHVERRYMRGDRACVGRRPARVTECGRAGVSLVLSDPDPPLAWSPACTWPRPESSRLERWSRAWPAT
jgi:hypothetical protein